MICLINYARQQQGLSTLTPASLLNETSLEKAEKIVRCNVSPTPPCGDAPDADIRAAHYYGAWARISTSARGAWERRAWLLTAGSTHPTTARISSTRAGASRDSGDDGRQGRRVLERDDLVNQFGRGLALFVAGVACRSFLDA